MFVSLSGETYAERVDRHRIAAVFVSTRLAFEQSSPSCYLAMLRWLDLLPSALDGTAPERAIFQSIGVALLRLNVVERAVSEAICAIFT